jgi:hypothetical protein
MKWLRGGRPSGPAAGDLAPVRIFTTELELRGSIAPAGQRVTDILLRGQDLAFLPEGAEPDPEAWLMVAPSDVLFVVPPPLSTSAPIPGGYELTTARIAIGPYRIVGSVHLREGDRIGPGMAQRQAFLPVTAATIEHEGADAESVEVAIVNLARSDELTPVAAASDST